MLPPKPPPVSGCAEMEGSQNPKRTCRVTQNTFPPPHQPLNVLISTSNASIEAIQSLQHTSIPQQWQRMTLPMADKVLSA